MSEEITTPEADQQPAAGTEQPKPTETVEFWKQKAREQEKRAKDNADAAKRLADIEESQKSEAQKQAERLATLEQEAATARTEALRLRVATRHGISDEDVDLFLTGTDEDTLTKQAERLSALKADERRKKSVLPSDRGNPTAQPDELRSFTRALFERD
ncbi:MAG TPA: hypothetical protein GX718_00450 [Brevibacterium sp.]|nr:hypothetical protein [Brevibacterium sp.]